MMKKRKEVIIITCVIILCMCVFPLCLIRKEAYVESNLASSYGNIEAQGLEMEQTFVAQTGYLSALAFDIGFPDGKPDEGTLNIFLKDANGKLIMDKTLSLQDVEDGALTMVSVDKWIKKGRQYSWGIIGDKDVKFSTIYTTKAEDDAKGNQALFFDGEMFRGGRALSSMCMISR